jgi:DNA-binding SARP family transcriptional activator
MPAAFAIRQSLLAARLRALDRLAEIHSRNLEPPLALRAAEEAVSLEPYRDAGDRRLMQIHKLAGNPAEALLACERLSRLLATELGMRPAPETQALLETIGALAALTRPSLLNAQIDFARGVLDLIRTHR